VATVLGASQTDGKRDKTTVQLVMGLTITPPPPHLSNDVIPKFNLVRDTKETVKTANFLTSETIHGAWAPEPQVSPEPKDNPVVPVPGNSDDDKEKERQKRELERWKRVRQSGRTRRTIPRKPSGDGLIVWVLPTAP
jgi:hypothetical protein